MSIQVDLVRLADELAAWGDGYLITAGDGAVPHVLALRPAVRPGDGGCQLVFDAGAGRGFRNARDAGVATLLFPPHVDADGYSLLIDATVTVEGAYLVLDPTSALLHRPAPEPPSSVGASSEVPLDIDEIEVATASGKLWLTSILEAAPQPDHILNTVDACLLVCLAEESEVLKQGVGYEQWLRANERDRALWFPIRNYGARDIEVVWPVVDTIAARIRSGQGVVMHCFHGHGRAGTVAVAVLVALGVSQDAAVAAVAAGRQHAGPGGAAQWDLVEAVARRAQH